MKIVISVLSGLILALGIALGVVTSGMNDQISNQTQLISRQSSQLSRQSILISSDESSIGDMQEQLNHLNIPTDPLSAYNAVCNSDLMNTQTGVTQLYYFPCTNSIIPAPGQ